MPERYLSPKTISKDYGIEINKIYYWIKTNRFDYFQDGRTILIPENSLLNYLQRNTHKMITDDMIDIPKRFET